MRSRTAALGAVLVFGGLSCQNDRVSIFVPRDGAESTILVSVAAGAAVRMVAVDASFYQDVASIPFGAAAEFDLYALSYGCSLSSLSLRVGPLPIETSTDPRHGRPLPAPSTLRRLHFAQNQPGSWEQVSQAAPLPDPLNMVRLVDHAYTPCVDFDTVPVTLDVEPDLYASFGVPLGGDAVLVGADYSNGARFYRVTKAGAVLLDNLPPSTPHQAGFRTDAGRIWMAGGDGKMVSGDLEHGFVSKPPLLDFGGNVKLSGSRGGAPFELFAFGDPLVLQHFADGAWTRNGKLPVLGGASYGVAWVAPNEAYAVASTAPVILHDKGGVTAEVPFDATQLASAILAVDGVGVVIGGDRGRLFFERDGTFETMMSSGLAERVRVMAPLDDGLAFMDRSSALQQYHPNFGFCDSAIVAGRDSNGLIPVDGGFAVIPSSGHGTLQVVYLVRRTPPPPQRCSP